MSERVVVDKGGRIVIPKPMRERLGFAEGQLLLLEERAGDLVIRHEEAEGGLVRRGKRLFKPKDRKAGAIYTEEVDRLIESLRDPQARNAIDAADGKKAAVKRAPATRGRR